VLSAMSSQFAARKMVPTSLAALKYIEYRENKTLRQFMERFTATTTTIPYLTPSIIMHLISGLQLGPLSDSLFIERLDNMDDLRERDDKYLAIEENKLKRAKKLVSQQEENSGRIILMIGLRLGTTSTLPCMLV